MSHLIEHYTKYVLDCQDLFYIESKTDKAEYYVVMKLLITGYTGQLGVAVQDLADECEDVVYSAHDICGEEVTRLILWENPDALINCAAYTNVDNAEVEKEKAYNVNVRGPENLARTCADLEIPLVHISSDYVFSGAYPTAYKPADRTDPINHYGMTKLLGEQGVRSLHRQHIIVRVSWLFGYAPNKQNFITKLLSWTKNNNVIKIVDDQVSSPTYTVDAAKVIFELLKNKQYGTWHMTNSGFCSRWDWAKFIVEYAKIPCTVLRASSCEFPSRALRPMYSILNTLDTERHTGIRIRDWRSATKEYLDFLKKKGSL